MTGDCLREANMESLIILSTQIEKWLIENIGSIYCWVLGGCFTVLGLDLSFPGRVIANNLT